MNETTEPRVDCPTCDLSYAWTAACSGRRVRCQCGQLFWMPTEPAGAPIVEDARTARVQRQRGQHDDPTLEQADLFACPACTELLDAATAVCMHCGFDMHQGRRVHVDRGPREQSEREKKEDAEFEEKQRMRLAVAACLLGGAVIGYLVWYPTQSGASGVAALGQGIGLLAVWLTLGTAALVGTMFLVADFLGEEYGSLWSVALKAAGMYLPVHVARAAMLTALGPQMPPGGYVGLGPALFGFAILAVCVGLVPYLLVIVILDLLYEVDLVERVVCTLTMWATSSLLFGLMKLISLPG